MDLKNETEFLLTGIKTHYFLGNLSWLSRVLEVVLLSFSQKDLCRPNEVSGKELLTLKGGRSHDFTFLHRHESSVKMSLNSEIKIFATHNSVHLALWLQKEGVQ